PSPRHSSLERSPDPGGRLLGIQSRRVDLDVVRGPLVDDVEVGFCLTKRPVLALPLPRDHDLERTSHADEQDGEGRPQAGGPLPPRSLAEPGVYETLYSTAT